MVTIHETPLQGVLILEPKRHGDARGFFSETFRSEWLAAAGSPVFVQDNHSFSAAKGVLRGLHFQVPPAAQGKLVRVSRGAVYDVVLDIRAGSPTYGRHHGEVLSAENWRQLWIPPGFAHGFVTLEPDTEFLYKVTSLYDPAHEQGLAFDDAALGIDWHLPHDALTLSPRDRTWPALEAFHSPFNYGAY